MKICIRCFLFLVVFLISQDANSEADGPDHWEVYGVEAGDVLNIRQEPNWKSQKIGEIPPDGKCLKNLRCVGGLTYDEFTNLSEAEKNKIRKERPRWCYIEYKRKKGWVAGRYLREGFCNQDSN